MNIIQARQIPLALLIEQLGGRYSHTDSRKQTWYFSPFRPKEKTASFTVHEQRNIWHDFGHVSSNRNSAGGDIIDLWCDYHHQPRKSAVKNALQALQALVGTMPAHMAQPTAKRPARREAAKELPPAAPRYQILKLHDRIFYKGLLEELQRRRISLNLAANYLQQVWLQDTHQPEKKRNGFAFANDKGGYEISIPNPAKGTSFKTSTRPKAITSLGHADSRTLLVFEGFWDFLSWLEMQDTPEPAQNIAVLNSLSFCGELVSRIIAARAEIDTVLLFLDNDEAGRKAAHQMADDLIAEDFTIRPMEDLYRDYKDLSDYWAKDPAAKKAIQSGNAPRQFYTGDSAWNMVMSQNKNRPRHL